MCKQWYVHGTLFSGTMGYAVHPLIVTKRLSNKIFFCGCTHLQTGVVCLEKTYTKMNGHWWFNIRWLSLCYPTSQIVLIESHDLSTLFPWISHVAQGHHNNITTATFFYTNVSAIFVQWANICQHGHGSTWLLLILHHRSILGVLGNISQRNCWGSQTTVCHEKIFRYSIEDNSIYFDCKIWYICGFIVV